MALNILTLHIVVVQFFLLIYLIKTSLLLFNRSEQLKKFAKTVRVPEMVISVLFLATGIYLLTQVPEITPLIIIKLVVVLAAIPTAIIGFKKENKALAFLSFILLISAYGLAEVNHKKMMNTPVKELANKADGKEIYTAYCMKCHGEDGKSGKMGSVDLSLSGLADDDIKALLHSGRNNMPSFSKQLEDAQIAAVAGYIKTLRK
jgi:cytochrome c553